MLADRVILAGTACRFPDAVDPQSLFANSLDGRQSFRPIPVSRLRIEDYAASSIGEPDSITPVPAGLLTGWTFDLSRFRIPRAAFEAADLAHWLALEVAADAIAATGVADRLDRSATAVVVANTLTGEFSRASSMRLRWPWLDRGLDEALRSTGIDDTTARHVRTAFRDHLWQKLRAPDEESLAGGLSNTIAGRIANHFDFKGGAFTVDGACASSLVAVSEAATLISSGRAQTVVVAAVDLSLDPFELVGFSRNGALAKSRMRVFDARAEGFWPGEGAGAIILMSPTEARRLGIDWAISLAGWAISTDGSGGLTRPSSKGQLQAISNAFQHAHAEPANVAYFEAHGTGTAIGDPTEVRALADFLGERRADGVPIGSIKGNIGHTKAAAGLAGLIRTASAMQAGIIPPHAGCEQVHPIFAETGDRVRVSLAPESWPPDRPVAGVSSFGFGGINAHVVLKARAISRPRTVPPQPPERDCSLFLFEEADRAVLQSRLEALAARAGTYSYAEVTDAAAQQSARLGKGPIRLAFSASSPAELTERLREASAAIEGRAATAVSFGVVERRPRIGLLFPGQAAPVRPSGGAWATLQPGRHQKMEIRGDPLRTDNAQPAIVRASLAGLDLLDELGIVADGALGHSLGELTALAWAGAMQRSELQALATVRGRAMSGVEPGAMLNIGCDLARARALAKNLDACPACFNRADEIVMAGPFDAIDKLEQRARAAGIQCARLPVSHAFHSPGMAAAASHFLESLREIRIGALERPVASTVTGSWLNRTPDVQALLIDQLTLPVRFTEAVAALSERTDVLIEVGPGAGLARLVGRAGRPVVALDVFSESLQPLTDALAALFVLGAEFDPLPLFEGPGIRALPDDPPLLLANPCGVSEAPSDPAIPHAPKLEPAAPVTVEAGEALPELLRLVAEETGMDIATLSADHRFLDDLHLNSLAVNRLVGRLSTLLKLAPPLHATAFSNVSLAEAAEIFEGLKASPEPDLPERVAGPCRWVRRFTTTTKPLPLRVPMQLQWAKTTLGQRTRPPGDGLLIALSEDWNCERDSARLLTACQRAVGRYAHLAIAHTGAPLRGFARSIAAERLFDSVRLIPLRAERAWLDCRVSRFEEILALPDGTYGVPEQVVLAATDAVSDLPLSTILVTGGARGIAAECAVRLAERRRSALILVGRTDRRNREVQSTLKRIRAANSNARYVQADVADRQGFREGIVRAAAELGPVTHLVHAAGLNQPTPFKTINRKLLHQTLAAKVGGLKVAVECCGPSLRRVIAFGSIIARLGLSGEAHYALANAEQSRLLDEIAQARPELSALTIDWSVWSGAGMGERLGVIDKLSSTGIDPLTLDQALDQFEALALSEAEGSILVASRFGLLAALTSSEPMRFLDRTLVHTPAVELVAETRVNRGRDPYLPDHQLGGGPLFPGVLMLEAMAQAAHALDPVELPVLSDVRFETAIPVVTDGTSLRVGALKEIDDSVRTEIRAGSDKYLGRRAGAHFGKDAALPTPSVPQPSAGFDPSLLYGSFFFQGERFHRLSLIGDLSSRGVAGLLIAAEEPVFGRFEPPSLCLGNPFVRDAALHALQCCVPHRRLVPVSAARIRFTPGGAPARFRAAERWSRGDEYGFDISIADETGTCVEHWEEAVFRSIGEIDVGPIIAACPNLIQPWLERRARETTGDDALRLAFIDDAGASRSERRSQAAAAIGVATFSKRGDGKPVTANAKISFAHSLGVTIAVCSTREVGCDVEQIASFAAAELALSWTAEEALRKLGSTAALGRDAEGLFTGDSHERVAAFAPVPTLAAGPVAVAIGTEAGG